MSEIKNLEHLAMIPDGNGRWAKKHKLSRFHGHYRGIKQALKLVDLCAVRKIKSVSVYSLSRYNLGRDLNEVNKLLSLLLNIFIKFEVKKLHQKNIKLNVIGDYHSLGNKNVSEGLERAMDLTKNNTNLNLNIAIAYSGRWDILQASEKMREQLAKGLLSEKDINEKKFSSFTQLGDLPDPEFCIRTGGEFRISDFCLWQLAYSEFYFTDTLWPDFDEAELDLALNSYFSRDRRFGLEAK